MTPAVLGALTGRKHGNPEATGEVAVLLVPVGGPPAPETVRRAVAAADGATVAVLVLLRIHGSSWGLPNPGLLPTAAEKAAARKVVESAIAAVEALGGRADGQITATRHDARVVTAAARRRAARLVLIERPRAGRFRTLVEGDVAARVRRRLGSRVEVVDADPVRSSRR